MLPSCRVFLSNLIFDRARSEGESSPRRVKMAYSFEWIPKFGNHPEKVAGCEYTPTPGGFTSGCGGFPERVVAPRRHLVAAWIVGERSADQHRIQEPSAIGNLCERWIALHGVGTHSVCGIHGLARRHDVAGPRGEI